MTEEENESATTGNQPYRVPGFIVDEDVGLGDVIKRIAHTVGIKACAGCERRAAALNRRFVFTRRAK